jgi:hypothetical protein
MLAEPQSGEVLQIQTLEEIATTSIKRTTGSDVIVMTTVPRSGRIYPTRWYCIPIPAYNMQRTSPSSLHTFCNPYCRVTTPGINFVDCRHYFYICTFSANQ